MYEFTIDGQICTEEEFFRQSKPYLVDCDLSRRIRVLRGLRAENIRNGKKVDYINLMLIRLLERAGIDIDEVL
jgi:hypothetical protein